MFETHLLVHFSLVGGGSPMVAKLVCSRVVCATEGTSRTPGSHFFLSPPEDGGFSGDT